MTLIQRILKLAELWAIEKGHSSTSRLSTLVVNDGNTLKRMEAGSDVRAGTLDRFRQFFAEGDNWPTGEVPEEALQLLEEVGHITTLPQADAA